MKIHRALVVRKKSLYQLYVEDHRESAVQEAIARRDRVAERIVRSHGVHLASLEQVDDTLSRRGIAFEHRWRSQVRSTRGFDLVIAIGGDGTVLDTAHSILDETPLLGINSNAETSVGKLCAGTAEQLDEVLEALASGALRPRALVRIGARIDGELALKPCLNDVLFAHRSPAEMSRFGFTLLPSTEALAAHPNDDLPWQLCRSSGLWVATATGSTAAIHSAGGRVMNAGSSRLQYVVREPYHPRIDGAPPAPWQGYVRAGEALTLVSRMRTACLWGDGPHHVAPVRYGQTVVIAHHPSRLHLIQRTYRA